MKEYRDWLITQDGHLTTLTLNRPHTQNNITHTTLDELRDITAYLGNQKDVWAVVLEGRGDHFSTGIDLNVITDQLNTSLEGAREYVRRQQACLDAFAELEKPTIAKLHGFCVGGGLLLALCCDFRIACMRTIFHLPEVRLGLPILWGTQRISRTVGEPQAKEMILLCKRLNAKDALRYGLIHKVVPFDALDEFARSLAKRFLRLPPRTVAVAKRIINEAYAVSVRESQDRELVSLDEVLGSPDVREAIQSHVESRRPEFIGE